MKARRGHAGLPSATAGFASKALCRPGAQLCQGAEVYTFGSERAEPSWLAAVKQDDASEQYGGDYPAMVVGRLWAVSPSNPEGGPEVQAKLGGKVSTHI
jgi:hypothetical protein